MKSSLIDSQAVVTQKADLYLESSSDKISLKNTNKIESVQDIYFTLIYNPDSINTIYTIKSIDNYIVNTEVLSPWFLSVHIKLSEIDNINAWSEIMWFEIDTSSDTSEHISILNARFVSEDWSTSLLSALGTEI